jgi:hypothetical protein
MIRGTSQVWACDFFTVVSTTDMPSNPRAPPLLRKRFESFCGGQVAASSGVVAFGSNEAMFGSWPRQQPRVSKSRSDG